MNGQPPARVIDRLAEGIATTERQVQQRNATASTEITPLSAERQIRGLFDVETLGGAMVANSWSAEREMALLIEIASDPKENTRARLAAAAMIRAIAEKSFALSGKIAQVNARRTMQADGSEVVVEQVNRTRLVGVADAAAQKLLEATQSSTQETPDAESPETDPEIESPADLVAGAPVPDADSPAGPDTPAGGGAGGTARKTVGGEPERDLGGGGLCAAAQRDARAARARAGSARVD